MLDNHWLVIMVLLVILVIIGYRTMTNLERLESEVSGLDSAVDSAVVLITGLADALRAALSSGNVEAEVGQIADHLDATKDRLAAAVAANTLAADDSTGGGDTTTGDPTASGDSMGGMDMGGTTQTQPQTGLDVTDENVPTNEPGDSLNPRTDPSDPVVGDEPTDPTA